MESTNEYGMQYSMQYPCGYPRNINPLLHAPIFSPFFHQVRNSPNPPLQSASARMESTNEYGTQYSMQYPCGYNAISIHCFMRGISLHSSTGAYSLHSSIQVRNSANPLLKSASARMESTNEYGMQYSTQYPCG